MKKTFLIVMALLMTVMVYSQRQELREASRSINNKDFNSAKQALSKIEGQIASQDASTQAEFYLYKGQALSGAAGNNEQDFISAADAFKKVIKLEESGRKRHTNQASEELQKLSIQLVQAAIDDQEAKRFSEASKKLYAGYRINKKDTSYLYFAAANAINAKEFDKAANFYEILLDVGYTGIEKEYVARDKESGEIVAFDNKEQQTIAMMTGEFDRPQQILTESRRPQILSDLVLIYADKGQVDKAKQLLTEARKNDPNNVGLIQAEANIALQENDMKTYNSLMQKIITTDPNNPEIHYNLGVSSANIGDKENARKYYEQALKLDPNFHNAKVNLSILILEKEEALIEEMNSLGTSAADNRKYDELIKQRNDMYREAIPYLESALTGRPNDMDIMRTLMNMYSILGDDAKFKNMRERIEAQEN